jgi:two-component system, NtrC family, sensor kinase
MKVSIKTRIWLTVFSIVAVFTLFLMFFFPLQQEKYFLKNYNLEVENLAKTVALGVKIAMTEQNFEGVQTALDFAKADKRMRFVALVQNDAGTEPVVLNIYPENYSWVPAGTISDSLIVKQAPFDGGELKGNVVIGFTTDEITKNMKDIRLTALLVSLVVFAFGILIGFWLARTISKPVLALRDAAIKVGSGDFSPRVKEGTKDEIGELSNAFNKMVTDLAAAEEKVKKAQDQLVQQEKMASLGQLTAGIAHEIQNPLNFVNNFSELSVELLDELEQEKDPEAIRAIIGDLKVNVDKIQHHGKRADNIVKGMLMHSRAGGSEKQKADLNLLIEEFLNLAYLGMRSADTSFNCAVEKQFDPALTPFDMQPQELSRVFLNLFNNSFYAIHEKSAAEKAQNRNFSPHVTVTTKKAGDKILISIKDNGPGIPDDVRDKIFNPFFTTKPTGKGTGLGLSMSYDIIVKGHGGSIKVDSEVGKFTEFTIELPLSS